METMTNEQRDAVIAALGLTYSAAFVPLSQSRNKDKVTSRKPSDWSLNWRVSIGKNGRSIETDYMQGIAHIPGYKHNQRWTQDAFDGTKNAVETGKSGTVSSIGLGRVTPIPAPLLRDVLASLVLDASVVDYPDFESWAGDFGYDADSRDAERIYRACLDIGLKLRAMLGDKAMADLRDVFQDY